MSHVIILAGSAQEANAYRRTRNLRMGRAVYAHSASIVDGVVPSEIHTLPGFLKRRDQHSVKAALKRARRKYQSVVEFSFDERGFVTDRVLEVAHRYNALRDQGIPEGVDPVIALASVEVTPADIVTEQTPQETSKSDDQEPSDTSNGSAMESEGAPVAPARRRRSKCRDCGHLHYKGDPCIQTDVDPAFFGG